MTKKVEEIMCPRCLLGTATHTLDVNKRLEFICCDFCGFEEKSPLSSRELRVIA